MQKTILSYGEALWDLLPDGPVLGGAPLNLAYRFHSLGQRGCLATRLGRDFHGNKALIQIIDLDLDTAHIQRDEQYPTGTVEVKLDEKGNPDFTIHRDVAYDYIELTYDLMELSAQVDCLCFGTLIQRAPTSALTLQRLLGMCSGKTRFLDLNLRKDCYDWPIITQSIQHATLLKMNEDEARRVAFGFDIPSHTPLPELCRALLQQGPLQACVVTLGEKGAFAVGADAQIVYVPGYEVTVADTCGSGDAFSAAFLHEYLQGKPLRDCCKLGVALGALVATQKGATEPVSPQTLKAFVQEDRRRLVDQALERHRVR
jgi:fructokinase